MWPFKKKESVTVKVIEKFKTVNVGVTKVEIIFKDGRQYNILIYGKFHQWTVGKKFLDEVITSLEQAKRFVMFLDGAHYRYFINPELNDEVVLGEITSAKILESSDYNKEVKFYEYV